MTELVIRPSSATKWIKCAASAQKEAPIPDDVDDPKYREEGTTAHVCAERALRNHIWREPFEKSDLFDGSMYEAADVWRKVIGDELQALGGINNVTLRVEDVVPVGAFTQEGRTGRIDAWLHAKAKKKLVIADFKYGIGVPVLAEDWPQGNIYALGAVRALRGSFEIETVDLLIVQPRVSPVPSRVTFKVEHLEAWDKEVCQPQRTKALSENPGDPVPGKWCSDGFCRARFTCGARAGKVTADFKKYGELQPKLEDLTPEKMGVLLPKIAQMAKWCRDIQSFANKIAAEKGVKIPGHYLTQKARRVCEDPEPLIAELVDEYFFDVDEIAPRQVLGITEMKKLVGSKHPVLAHYKKAWSAPTLAAEGSNAPRMERTALDHFDGDEDEPKPEDF